jgi:hypothetical protein
VSPPPPQEPASLAISLEATRFATSLTQAVLRFRLHLTNQADEPLGPLTIGATLASPDNGGLGEQDVHHLILIQPGAQAQVSGEARLPLGLIAPIRLGNSDFFVPLLRVEVEARRVGPLAGEPALQCAEDFLVGGVEEGGRGALVPIRLDGGPLTLDKLTARAVSQEG